MSHPLVPSRTESSPAPPPGADPASPIAIFSIDAYGTIFDAGPVFEQATAEVAKHHGGLDAAKLSQAWGRHFNELYHATTDCDALPEPFPTIRTLTTASLERTLREFDIDDDPARGTEIWIEHLQQIRLYDDVLDALQMLQGRCRLILTSDSDEEFILPVLETLALPFEHIFVSETCRTYKMSRQDGLLDVALRRLEADPAQVVHVGDSAADLIAAKRAGCRGVWSQRPGQPSVGHTPWRTITSLRHLADL